MLLKRLRTSAILCSLEWVPSPAGRILRRIFYKLVFSRLGKHIVIDPYAKFSGTDRILLEDNAWIWSGALLSCVDSTGRIHAKKNARIESGANIQSIRGNIDLGENICIGPYTCLAGPGSITIGNNVLIASHCGIYANNHIFARTDIPINAQGCSAKGISIGDDCWLGSGVKVVDGVSIGQGCVIGAGAVVTRDLPPYSIAVGIPAKPIGVRPQL